MSRSLVLGNGGMLVALDQFGQVRDFYYPHVGEELQTGDDCVHRIGVYIDGECLWLDNPAWSIHIDYQEETLASRITATLLGRDLTLEFLDIVYNERDIFVRRITVINSAKRKRVIKVFLNQQFIISESSRGNTAFYEPALNAIVHHRGRRVFLVGGVVAGVPFTEYSVGHFNSHGREGTWRDAEDGMLDGNSIEHGKVDSTIGFTLRLAAGSTMVVDYWIAAGETLALAKREHSYLINKTPDHLIETTQDYWRAWVNKYRYEFFGLSADVARLFKRSLLIMRTHVDKYGGIIASCDAHIVKDGFDTYGYVWPRDAAYIATAFTKAGYLEIAQRFFEFAKDIISDEGYFYHKYTVTKALGSSWHAWVKDGKRRLPIQEDETALVLDALSHYYDYSKNIELIEELYNPLIKHAADFLCSFRDPATHLPRPSYDLWEEKYAVTVFTTSATYAGLIAARQFAELLGKEQDAERFSRAAEEIRDALFTYLIEEESAGTRLLCFPEGSKKPVDDTLDVSNFYGLYAFNVLSVTDPRLLSVRDTVLAQLSPLDTIGGVMRHKDDYYYRVHADLHGNMWFITTLWIAEADIRKATTKEEIIRTAQYFEWIARFAQSSGVLSEQVDPRTGAQLSVAPLIWSHAQFVLILIMYLEKVEALGLCKTCYPLEVR